VSTRDRTLFPLLIRPRLSRRLAAVLTLAHALAVLAAAHAPSPAVALVLCALVLLHGVETIRLHVLRRGPRAVRELKHDGRGGWWLTTGDGERRAVTLADTQIVTPPLVVVGVRAGSRRWWLPLATDGEETETLRRLRVVLRARTARDSARDQPLAG
jgi:hypothetical protein